MISKKTIILIFVLLMVFLLFITLLAISTRNIVIIDLPAPKSLVSQEELERREKRRELEEEKEEVQKILNQKVQEEFSENKKLTTDTRNEIANFVNEYYEKEQELLSQKEIEEKEARKEMRKRIYEEANNKIE